MAGFDWPQTQICAKCSNYLYSSTIHSFTSGDHFYKRNKNLPPEEQMISALPDIKVLTLTDDHEFMVIACDGIW